MKQMPEMPAMPVGTNGFKWGVARENRIYRLAYRGKRSSRGLATAWLTCFLVSVFTGDIALSNDNPSELELLPDGNVALFATGSVRQAWYVQPTSRYPHGALGDNIEAGGLAIRGADGELEWSLLDPATGVYEDLTPRLVDLDGDGNAEIVSILAHPDKGAYVGILTKQAPVAGESNRVSLTVVAQSSYTGLRNRWLNIAGIADYDGDGRIDIALVRTPHIGGTLEFWSYSHLNDPAPRLSRIAAMSGFSNHEYGSRQLNLSASLDWNDDGLIDLIVPSNDRTILRIMGFVTGQLKELDSVVLPSEANGNFSRTDTHVLVPLANGTVFKLP